jgi:hypothetical protein
MKLFRILLLILLLFSQISITHQASAENGSCPDSWQIGLRPLTISDKFPPSFNKQGELDPSISKFLFDDYFYINYPRSTYELSGPRYLNRFPDTPNSVAEYASKDLSTLLNKLGPNAVVFERWEISDNGSAFRQLKREEGGSNYDQTLESAIGSDHYWESYTFWEPGFSVSTTSLRNDELMPGSSLRLTLEVKVKDCAKSGIFSTNSILIPESTPKTVVGYEKLLEINSLYGNQPPNFIVQEKCSSYPKALFEWYVSRLDKTTYLDLNHFSRQQTLNSYFPQCNGLGFTDLLGNSIELVDLDGKGCLDFRYPEYLLLANNCNVGLTAQVRYYSTINGKIFQKWQGQYRLLLAATVISKTFRKDFSLNLPKELYTNSSYGDVLNDVKITVDGTETRWSKTVVTNGPTYGNYLEFGPANVCYLEGRTPAELIGGSGVLKTKEAGICNVSLIMDVAEKFWPTKLTLSYKVGAEQKVSEKAKAPSATTITCVKGKLTKKVTAIKPKCPAGYKRR